MTGHDHWTGLLRQVLAGRPVLVAMDVLVAAAETAGQLEALGVEDLLLVSGVRGVGDVDPRHEAGALVLDTGTRRTLMSGIRAWQAVIDDLPADARARIDAFDPARRAWVVSALFQTSPTVAGRPVLGARPASWQALEDKTVVDAVWDAAGIARAPARVVDLADTAAVRAAARDLDLGHGTCWVADNSSGWHGGGEYLRWTGPAGDPSHAVSELAAVASRARVMPFLDGRPCSIHGWVFDDHVAALRPCEMVVWRREDRRFEYGGASTVWEPPAADREEMQDVARRVGAHLRETVGYRGTFTVDGILTGQGFRPTELNPRFGGGLLRVGAGIDLPLYLLHLATVTRPELDWRPQDLELAVLEAADATPVGRVMLSLPGHAREGTWWLKDDGAGCWVDAADGETADAVLAVGPSVSEGRLAMVHLSGLPRGRSAAEYAVPMLPAIAERVGAELPRLTAAPDLRR